LQNIGCSVIKERLNILNYNIIKLNLSTMKKLHYFLSIVLTLLLLTGVQKQNFAQAKSFGGELIVKIGLAAKPNVDDITLQFIESGTEEFNGDYDAYKMFGGPANPYLYILIDDQGFQSEVAVKAFPLLSKNKTIKLGIKTEISGNQNYVMNFEKLNTIDEQVQIYLKDLILNDSVDLRANGSYSFQSAPFYNNERFELKFFVPASFEAEVNPKGPVTICQEENVELSTKADTAYTYQWYKDAILIENATDATYSAFETGVYYVEVTFGQNKAISNNVEVIVNILPFVFIEPDNDKEKFCQGDTLNILAFGEGENLVYQWKKDDNIIEGATSTIITVKEAGVYLVEATNSCGSTPSETYQFIINPLPVLNIKTDTTVCDTVKVVLDAGEGFAKYLWSNDSTSRTITVDTTGVGIGTATYTVMVEDTNGCQVTAEIKVTFDECTGIRKNDKINFIDIYPNPNKGVFTLKNCDAFETIEIFNLAGQRIYNNNLTTSIVDINLGTINKGLYILKATGNKGSIYKKIVVE